MKTACQITHHVEEEAASIHLTARTVVVVVVGRQIKRVTQLVCSATIYNVDDDEQGTSKMSQISMKIITCKNSTQLAVTVVAVVVVAVTKVTLQVEAKWLHQEE